ncbi:hypothetical protein AMK26_03205 [Streptomyces sp. CB03234]|uniref:hypothetical protein n=1 Tax=Streptomyces sp. (strain CB03234) TaxID=1703937 RepID=UPI00093C3A71|nr:hypothetical protein [Streptomyces sp. CB03234]OKK08058.1 hypothetical protein AMK26_03205 [Streptomyces sp. CB03234]
MADEREELNAQLRTLIGISAGIPLGPGMGVPESTNSPDAAVDDPICLRCGLPAGHLGEGPAGRPASLAPVASVF